MMVICKICGMQNADNSSICSNCGAGFSTSLHVNDRAPQRPAYISSDEQSSKRVLGIITSLGLSAMIVYIALTMPWLSFKGKGINLFQYLDSLEKIEGLLSLVKGYVSLDYFYLLKALFFVALLPAVLAAAYIIAVLFKLPSLHAYGTATGVVSILVSIVWYAAFTFIFRDSQWLSLISLAQQGTHPNLFSALSSLVDSGIILGTAPIFITTVVFIRLFVDENILSAKYFLNQAGLM